jgi:hypothetical protein
MENVFFDKNGIINLDEIVANSESFKKIMADGYVSDDELKQQAENVVQHLRNLESICSTEQLSAMKETIAELGVLFATYHYKTLQEIRM